MKKMKIPERREKLSKIWERLSSFILIQTLNKKEKREKEGD